MWQTRIHSVAFITFLLILCGVGYGQDDTCVEPPLPTTKAELLEPYTAVFSGKVIEIKEAHVHDVMTFEVTRSWKGVDTKEVEVRKAFAGYKGVEFEMGEVYLVFASEEGNDLRVNSCSRTKKLAEAGPEIKLLEEQPSARHEA